MKWLLTIVAALIFVAVVSAAVLAGGLYWYFSRDLPQLESLKDYNPMINTVVYSDDGTMIAEFAEEYRKVVPLKQIPPYVVNAFLAVEDARFYEHRGLDFYRIAGALWHDIQAGGKLKEGASTITMQLARTFFLSRKKIWDRKIKEGILAWRIDHYLKKDEILWLYLTQIYLGHNCYGVEAASEKYYSKPIDQVNLAEAALLAAIPRGPAIYSPINHFDEVKKRQGLVLRRMVEEKFITQQEADAAAKQPITIKYKTGSYYNDNAYFVESVRRYLVNRYGYDKVYKEGLKVFTTMNVEMQASAAAAVRLGIAGPDGIDRRRGYRGPVSHLEPDKVNTFLLEEEAKLKEHWFFRNLIQGGDPQVPAPQPIPLLPAYKYQAVVRELDKTGKKLKLEIGATKAVLTEVDYRWALAGSKPVDKVFAPGDIIQLSVTEVKESKGAREYKFRLEQDPAVQAGLLSFAVRSGEVKALIGGYDFNKSHLIRPLQSVRQPGSAFKPVLYGAALENPATNYTPASIIFDTPVIYSYRTTEESEDGEKVSKFHTWTPGNYGGRYCGPRTMRTALEKSINTISVKIVEGIGVDYALNFAKKLGIKSPMEANFAMALGTNPLSLLELMRAYNVYASGGYLVEPYLIRRVYDHDGKLLEWRKPEAAVKASVQDSEIEELDLAAGATVEKSRLKNVFDKINPTDPVKINEPGPDAYLVMLREKRIPQIAGLDAPAQGDTVVSPQLAFLMTSMMQGVVQRGTGAAASALGRPLAGKTGTTNEFRDAWFVGFSPEIIAGVWVGYDDYRISLGSGNAGARAALPIWMHFMKTALSARPTLDFPVPQGIEFARIDQKTGQLANSCTEKSVMESFIAGTVPSEYSTCGAIPPSDDLIQRLDY